MSYPLWFQSIQNGDGDDATHERGRPHLVSADSNAELHVSDPHALLATRIRQGDADAFGLFVERVLDESVRVATYVGLSRDVAKDVVQEALIRLWERRTALDPTRPIVPYLLAIVRNCALDTIKARRVRERYQDRMAREMVDAVASPAEPGVVSESFDAAMAALPDRQRLAVQLRYQEQMSYADVGMVLDLSPNAAHQLALRGLQALRRRLGVLT